MCVTARRSLLACCASRTPLSGPGSCRGRSVVPSSCAPLCLAEPAGEPGAAAAQGVELVVALLEAVRLARVDDQLVGHAVAAQAAREELGLRNRHALVALAVEHQDRGLDAVDEGDRADRVVLVRADAFPAGTAAEPG